MRRSRQEILISASTMWELRRNYRLKVGNDIFSEHCRVRLPDSPHFCMSCGTDLKTSAAVREISRQMRLWCGRDVDIFEALNLHIRGGLARWFVRSNNWFDIPVFFAVVIHFNFACCCCQKVLSNGFLLLSFWFVVLSNSPRLLSHPTTILPWFQPWSDTKKEPPESP